MTITNYGLTARRVAVDSKGIRTASDTYKLEATDNETLYQIGADPSVPQIGTSYPNDPTCWCVSIDVALADGKRGYDVTCSYSSEFEVSDNPLNEPARISWSGENFQQVAVVDIDDNPILNSAGDPYDPPLMKDFSRPVATIRKNISSAPAWILTSHDAINSDEFVIDGLTCLVGKAKLKRADISEPQTKNGVTYRELTLVIHFSKDGWTRKVLDAGFRRKYNDTERELITITAEDGTQQYPPSPVPLDGSGVELTDPTPSTCVYNSHELDESIPFSSLPLS